MFWVNLVDRNLHGNCGRAQIAPLHIRPDSLDSLENNPLPPIDRRKREHYVAPRPRPSWARRRAGVSTRPPFASPERRRGGRQWHDSAAGFRRAPRENARLRANGNGTGVRGELGMSAVSDLTRRATPRRTSAVRTTQPSRRLPRRAADRAARAAAGPVANDVASAPVGESNSGNRRLWAVRSSHFARRLAEAAAVRTAAREVLRLGDVRGRPRGGGPGSHLQA
jgi:hypothetical protein